MEDCGIHDICRNQTAVKQHGEHDIEVKRSPERESRSGKHVAESQGDHDACKRSADGYDERDQISPSKQSCLGKKISVGIHRQVAGDQRKPVIYRKGLFREGSHDQQVKWQQA